MSRYSAQQPDCPKDFGQCSEVTQRLYQQRPMKLATAGLHKLASDRHIFGGGVGQRKLEGQQPPPYVENGQQAPLQAFNKPAAVLEPIPSRLSSSPSNRSHTSKLTPFSAGPAQQSTKLHQPAAAHRCTASAKQQLQQTKNQNEEICEQVAWKLQEIKRGGYTKRQSAQELLSSALSLLDQHFDRHFPMDDMRHVGGREYAPPTTHASTTTSRISNQTTQPTPSMTVVAAPRQQSMFPTSRLPVSAAAASYRTVCKYVRFDQRQKVVDETYIIYLKSNRLADLKQGLPRPASANTDYGYFVRNRNNQLEQIVNEDQLLFSAKDTQGQDVIVCEIVEPSTIKI